MNLRQERKRREDFLITLWEMHAGNYGGDQSTKEVCRRIGIDYDTDGSIVGQYLYRAGLVKWASFEWISLTPEGIREAERIVELRYAEKERRVLQKLYDERERRYTNPHQPDELARELNLDLREVQDIVIELERKGLTKGNDQATWIIAAGMELIESGGQQIAAPGVSFTTNIHGPNYGGIQQGGQGNTQNVTLTNTNNADFDRALASIVELIRASNLPAHDKEELEGEIVNVNKLALREPSPGLLERAKSRLDLVRLGLQGGDLLIKAGPHLEVAWEFLKHKFGG
jgi:Mn-dependent DtxR family transcriptional regulator